MYRIAKRMFVPRTSSPNRCQPDRQQLQTLLPAFNDHGLDCSHGRAKSYPE